MVTLVVVQTTLDVVAVVDHHRLVTIAQQVVALALIVVSNTLVVLVAMDLAVVLMSMVAVVTGMDLITHTVTTTQDNPTWVDHNHLDTHNVTIPTDISLMLHGVLVEMVPVRVTVEQEDVKVL